MHCTRMYDMEDVYEADSLASDKVSRLRDGEHPICWNSVTSP